MIDLNRSARRSPGFFNFAKKTGPGMERVITLTLVLSALIVVTCARGSGPPPSVAQVDQTAPASSLRRKDGGAIGAVPTSAVESIPRLDGSVGASTSHLTSFFRALGELAQGSRKEPVRVLWFGDSHTAADFWTHRLRLALWQRFGAAGPGFIHLGLKGYRHSAARVEQGGKWRLLPRAPSSFIGQQGDGVYGLGGMRAVPKNQAAWATVEPARGSLRGRARWQILYRLPTPQARFEIKLGSATLVVDRRAGKQLPSGLYQVDLDSPVDAALRVESASSGPELFGAIVEGTEPGVVVDTLGINGARLATPLTWDESSFVAEVRARDPSLIILAYGTNEIGDELAPWHYAEHLDKLVARMRAAAPEAACLIVGPTDRAAPDWGSNSRTAEIDQVERVAADRLGCQFFSTLEAMGGPGSLKTWAFATPPLARKDHVHLTPQGYGVVGDALAAQLLDDYEHSAFARSDGDAK